jgi:hypothetical protein
VGIILEYLLEFSLSKAILGTDRYYPSGENRVALDNEGTQVTGK